MPRLSPDGRFVAYISDESGRQEIYVQSFPDGAAKWPVSANSGVQPLWSKDGNELFYVQGDTLMAAPVTAGSEGFTTGTASPLLSHAGWLGSFKPLRRISRRALCGGDDTRGRRRPAAQGSRRPEVRLAGRWQRGPARTLIPAGQSAR